MDLLIFVAAFIVWGIIANYTYIPMGDMFDKIKMDPVIGYLIMTVIYFCAVWWFLVVKFGPHMHHCGC